MWKPWSRRKRCIESFENSEMWSDRAAVGTALHSDAATPESKSGVPSTSLPPGLSTGCSCTTRESGHACVRSRGGRTTKSKNSSSNGHSSRFASRTSPKARACLAANDDSSSPQRCQPGRAPRGTIRDRIRHRGSPQEEATARYSSSAPRSPRTRSRSASRSRRLPSGIDYLAPIALFEVGLRTCGDRCAVRTGLVQRSHELGQACDHHVALGHVLPRVDDRRSPFDRPEPGLGYRDRAAREDVSVQR